MLKFFVFTLGLYSALSFAAESRFNAQSVWRPKPGEMGRIQKTCTKALQRGQFQDVGDCFFTELKKRKVHSEVLRFVKMIDNTGYMTHFKKIGPVDLAYVTYPFRANQNEGCYLVNGTPSLIDVDSPSVLSFKNYEIESSIDVVNLRSIYPQLSIFPESRRPDAGPQVVKNSKGEFEFIFKYSLKDGCRACALVGQLEVFYRFRADGKYEGYFTRH